ncbi:MAG: polyprenyl synthetase family protein [Chloroflexi bacterium]|nr:polyprenyl synthetase family protein [Chloroflexota bacterium]
MWQKRQAEQLREEIEAVLAALPNEASFHDLVKRPLTHAKRGLAADSTHNQPWALLPLLVCEAISGHYEQALPVAAAVQFLMAASDVFDDLEDADCPESLSARYGPAMAINTATALLSLAQRAEVRLEARGIDARIVVRAVDAVSSFCINACAGQHLDLSPDSSTSISEDTYLRMASLKSAWALECACYVGTLLATANEELIATFALFGRDLGIAVQIANDIHGIGSGNDIAKRKVTLPVIYALAQTDGDARGQLERAFLRQAEFVPDAQEVRDLLFRTGAMHYATVIMELYRQRAGDNLSRARQAGANVERLKLFLG